MNCRFFRLLYNDKLAMFVPVPEFTRARGKGLSGKRMPIALASLFISLLVPVSVNAAPPLPIPIPLPVLPTAGLITSGAGKISTNGTIMTVQQNTSKMIVNWDSFNIGPGHTVNFAQPNANSAVLNRVSSSGGQSQIYGNLNANGQVYLINPNGILFGNGTSVNVNSLIASSLNLTDNLFNQGILSITNGDPAFTGTTNNGSVQVDVGANLMSANGGKIMLFAPSVTNNGLIQTPEGQAILAAGNTVYLSSSAEPNLRGLLIELDGGGTVTNTNFGTIAAQHGNVTLAGLTVNQSGYVKATTSVTANGSIRLQAQDTTTPVPNSTQTFTSRVATNGGSVIFGANSVTEVMPDTSDNTTVIDSTLVQSSFIDVLGSSIHLMSNAWIVAPGGNVSLYAGLNPYLPSVTNPLVKANSSNIYFDPGSVIDVSGVGSGSIVPNISMPASLVNGGVVTLDWVAETAANVSVSNNIVVAQLLGNELRDSPLQRKGILYTSKVYVDSRVVEPNGSVGTTVADVSGYTSQIGHTVSERLAEGGNVSIQSEGNVVFAPNASVNVSGGMVNYVGGSVTTTQLLASSGKSYDISVAPNYLTYVSMQNINHQEQGYTEGKNAGSVLFSAPAMVLQGSLEGGAIAGIHQDMPGSYPNGATLKIGNSSSMNIGGVDFKLPLTHVLHSDIVFDDTAINNDTPVFSDLGSSFSIPQKQTLVLGGNFSAPFGFSNLEYFADGQITVKSGTNIQTMPGGSIIMNAGGIDVLANLTSRGGTISLIAKREQGYNGIQDKTNFKSNTTSSVAIDNGVALDVSGIWINDLLNTATTEAIFTTGGNINLSANGVEGAVAGYADGNVILGTGSLLNASGGAWLNYAGILTAGNGGAISLAASGGYRDAATHLGKIVIPDGSLRADSLSTGGSLSLTSGSVTIGSVALATNGELLLDPHSFRVGGFTSYSINSYEHLTIENGTTLAPVSLTRILDKSYGLQTTGTDIASFSHLELLPSMGQSTERISTNLSLNATTLTSGVLSLGSDSTIMLDPSANLSLVGGRQLTALGNIFAPSGQVSMTLGHLPSMGDPVSYLANETLWLGSSSVVDVSAVADVYTNVNGLQIGSIKSAGNITLTALTGEIVANKGAVLNLEGTHAAIDLSTGNSYNLTDVASNGGNLTISAREGVLLDGTLNAHGGNTNANVRAGIFSLNMTYILDPLINSEAGANYPTGPRQILIESSGSVVPQGLSVGAPISSSLNGKSYVFADKLTNAGFDAVSLVSRDNITFDQNVTLKIPGAITLDTPNVYINNKATVNLNSSYVGIGNSQPAYQGSTVNTPTVGSAAGSLVVAANYIDLFGNQNLSGASDASFTSAGDIQLRGILPINTTVLTPSGSLNTAGNLEFTASKIYPTTLSNYTISSPNNIVTFASNGEDASIPFSVMGTLNVQAKNILQGGVLRAPFGVINLDATDTLTLAPNSLTSVSAEGQTLPFGTTSNGSNWTFDFGDRYVTIATLPEKAVNLRGNSVNVVAGSNGQQSAKIDVSGTGNLQAWEFTTGPGGSDDVLAAQGIFAVLPGVTNGYMSGNSQSFGTGGIQPGAMIYLSGGNGLAAGNYVLLPAHYALMSGGYTVKVVSNLQDMVAQQNTITSNGAMLVSGYFMQYGGVVADSRSSGFLVASGSIARAQSEFTDTLASSYFATAYNNANLIGYHLPGDAGRLSMSAFNNLTLNGIMEMGHAVGSRGAEVDISSSNIAISGNSSNETALGYLTLTSDELNKMGAESLMIGGTRSSVASGTQLNVSASHVKLINGASLTGQEVILAATDTVSMDSKTSITGSGTASVNGGPLVIGSPSSLGSGDGAVLLVSSGTQRDLIRNGVSPISSQKKGTLILDGSITQAESVIADATFSNSLNGSVALAAGGSLSIGAPKISFGDTTFPVSGMSINNNQLTSLGNSSNLQFKSYSTLDFYGDVALGNSNLQNLSLKSLILEGSGMNNYGSSVLLNAGLVKFSNTNGATFVNDRGVGSGKLVVNAKEIVSGDNTFNLSGFNTVQMNAEQLVGQGNGSLNVKGDLSISAYRITTASLSNQTISATGLLQTSIPLINHFSASTPVLSSAELGGNLTITAETIEHGGNIEMPAGTATLIAFGQDGIWLQPSSIISTKGSAQMLGTVSTLVDGGNIRLQAPNGNLEMQSGATLDVSATGGASAGTLAINVAGTANLLGALNGSANPSNNEAPPQQGSFEYLASTLVNFSTLNSSLNSGGFNQSRSIHIAHGDLTVAQGDTVTAKNITLTTDNGNLTIDGHINASGSNGGVVSLNAGEQSSHTSGNITLTGSAVIDASATSSALESAGSTGDGGKVTLNTSTSSDISPEANASTITLLGGSVINLSSKGAGSDGTLVLRAPRTGITNNTDAGTGVAVVVSGAEIHGAIIVEGVKTYTNAGDLSIDSAYIATLRNDNSTFLNDQSVASTLTNITNGLSSKSSKSSLSIISGDEIRSSGGILVNSDIELQSWGSGSLTLRAAGDVVVNNSISAGFTPRLDVDGIPAVDNNNNTSVDPFLGFLTNGGAWIYRIVAGADLKSANAMSTNNVGTGNFILGSGAIIRTGTGDIQIATGGNFTLKDSSSAIYTAGTPGDLPASYPEIIPISGGNITIASKGYIQGALSSQLPGDWLVRDSNINISTTSSWYPFFQVYTANSGGFYENIGALGGGNINISAGSYIKDFSAVTATNGQVFTDSNNKSTLIVNGGGDLLVRSGGDISGGLYMVDKGTATIRASGALLADSSGNNVAIALGDGKVNIETLGQLNLMTVFNPMITNLSKLNQDIGPSYFSTYGADSSVTLASVSSGVVIATNQTAHPNALGNGGDILSDPTMSVFPGTLKVGALGGDLRITGAIAMAPSAIGELQLATEHSLIFEKDAYIAMSDTSAASLPSPLFPSTANTLVANMLTSISKGQDYHASSPVHQLDNNPVVIYAGMDILGSINLPSLILPKEANISAAHDIVNLGLLGQNLTNSDSTNISAGNDLYFSPYQKGNDYIANLNGIFWGGPGYLNIAAGRNINLGNAYGIVTKGNLVNPFLPEVGASISILAGASSSQDDNVIAKYLDPSVSNMYASDLTKFVQSMTGSDLTDPEAWSKFQLMDNAIKHEFVQSIFFKELKMAGIEHNDTSSIGYGNYTRGYDIIETMFPNSSYNGSVNLSGSQIKTERGGDLNIMSPGGNILVGLPKIAPSLLISKDDRTTPYNDAPSILGIFTVQGGNINMFSRDSIEVAQSRVFTIAGGNVLMWSTLGGIDAGKGSKTSTSAPPPLVRTDLYGNTVIDLAGVVTGSGIGTLQTLASAPVGDVYLIAPVGTVNAGDAGVRSSGNLLVAAQSVLGASNMQAGGTTSGVPAVSSASISFNVPVSADSASNSKQANQLGDDAAKSSNKNTNSMPSLITVEVLALGDDVASSNVADSEAKKTVKKQ